MDSDEMRVSSRDVVRCCDYSSSSLDLWTRTVKRKFNEEGNNKKSLLLRGSSDSSSLTNAKLLVENQCSVLLEDLSVQRETVKDLYLELEQERNAAASAANETMSMILRLQREKAEIQMEARQFKAFADEKMMHDEEKLSAFDNLLYEKDQAIEVLSHEVEVYKDRLFSFGITEGEMNDQILGFGRDSSSVLGVDVYPCEYTSLKCSFDENHVEDVEKVVVTQSPRWPYYDPNSPLGAAKEIKKTYFADSPMSSSSDRVYTIDSIHVGVKIEDDGVKETDIDKLYTRLQALEADKESLRQVIVSMQTDKAQLVLLKGIAQHLSKETERRNPLSKMPFLKAFSVVMVFKWIASFVSWKRKADRSKYVYNLSANNMGMLMILGDESRTRRWSCITSSLV